MSATFIVALFVTVEHIVGTISFILLNIYRVEKIPLEKVTGFNGLIGKRINPQGNNARKQITGWEKAINNIA